MPQYADPPLIDDVMGLLRDTVRVGRFELFRFGRRAKVQATKSATVLEKSAAVLEQKWNTVVREKVDPLLLGKRNEMVRQLRKPGEPPPELSWEERQTNRNLGLTCVLTGAAVATAPIGGPVAFLACAPLAGYMLKDVGKAAWHSVTEEHKLGMPVLTTVNHMILWFSGFYGIGCAVFALTGVGRKISLVVDVRTRGELVNVFGQLPDLVTVLRDGTETQVPLNELQAGELLVIQAGQTIPVDGTVAEGVASVDQCRLTGESQPSEKQFGDPVFAATVVLAGTLVVRVERSGQQTVAAQIGEMLMNTASHQLPAAAKARKLADRSVAPTLAGAALAFVTAGPAGAAAITSTMVGLNLMISGPIALRSFLSAAARQSILLKDGGSFDRLATVDTVVFDKTGTLTLDQPTVTGVHALSEVEPAEILALAAALEQYQNHPIARAIVKSAREHALPIVGIAESTCQVGYGLRAKIDDRVIRVGSQRFMNLEGVFMQPRLLELQEELHATGDSVVMVAADDRVVGAIQLTPTLRPEAKAVIEKLRRRKLKVYIISGDQEGPTRALAQQLGIEDYFANTLPAGKADHVRQLQEQGRSVCFVGDGLNDSVAMKTADLSISLHGAATAAIDTARIVLMDANLNRIPLLFQLSEELKENLNTSEVLAVVPTVGIWSGVFFLHLGTLGAAAIFEASLWAGIANAVRPLFKYKAKELPPAPVEVQ